MQFKSFPFLFSALILFGFSSLLLSCQKDEEKRLEEQRKDAKAKELIFNNISKGWNFATPPLNPKTQSNIAGWSEMRMFLTELMQKPKSTIGAFQKKAKTLSKKATELNVNIPASFNKPEIRSRISVLTTKINSIDLFIHLDDIPDQKVVANITDANTELQALYRQMDEIIRKSEIPKEEGESDMIRMLDTSRAIPNLPAPVSTKKPSFKKFQ